MCSKVCQKMENLENLPLIVGEHSYFCEKATHKISEPNLENWLSASHFKLYKGLPKKHKGILEYLVIRLFLQIKQFKSNSCAMGCNPLVLALLLTPITTYIDMAYVRCCVCHFCHKCQKCHILRVWYVTSLIQEYIIMGVKRNARTSGLQPNAF